VPLHAWLPLAHPAAPSHVSALMSGVMTKVAVYGFVRLVFDLAGPPAWWWSVPVLVIAAVTALLGVLYALMEHDLKRLLAYHTVENIGIIFIGLGLALAFEASGLGAAAALAFGAAIFHVFNHSLFKSLLFMGSGAVLNASGERDMERLGGLIHRMPVTAVAFLAGCIAISALPPFNGFVSEWLTFQAILLSPQLPQWVARLLVRPSARRLPVRPRSPRRARQGVRHDLSGAPRSMPAAAAAETDRFSQIAMLLLALLCLLTGILPGFVLDSLGAVTQLAVGARLAPQSGSRGCASCPSPSPQRLQRAVRVRHDCARRRHHRLRGAPRGLARPATLSRLGLRFPGYEPRDAVHRGKLRAAHPACVRQCRLSCARRGHHAEAW